jgi:hypothetical protein
MAQTIDIRTVTGGREYTWPLTITETTGEDITGDLIQLSLGTLDAPGEWKAPDTDTSSDDGASRTVQLLVGDTLRPPSNAYWLWSRVTDSPEVVPRRHDMVIVVNDI